MDEARVLVVRHGSGRGRLPHYLEPVLASLRQRDPRAATRVRIHETGAPPPSLDGVAAVVFWLADPLREAFPACFDEATALAGEARSRGATLVNPPEALSNSIKSRQARLWQEAGFETPQYVRYESRDELLARAEGIGFPLVIRSDEDHGQRGMRVLSSMRRLVDLKVEEILLPGSAAPFFDMRPSHRERDPQSPYSRLHHKKRIYVLGDRVRTEHVFFAAHALVSARTSLFKRLHDLPAWRRALAMTRRFRRRAIAEDVAYWERETEHADLMLRATGALGFQFAAVDYSVRGDGSVVLWEANPHPSLPLPEYIKLPALRRGPERIESYHRAVGDFLLRLLPEFA